MNAQVLNDVCTNAITLTHGLGCTITNGTVADATINSLPGNCSGNSDVFYKFIATSSNVTIRVTGSAGLDPVVGLYASCLATNSLVCTDVNGSGGTEVLTYSTLTIGTTYFIKVSDYLFDLPTTFTFTICVSSGAGVPSNDLCQNAISLTPSPSCTNTLGSILGATTTSSTFCSGNSDVFYKFVAVNTTATIQVTPSNGFDPVVAVASSCATTSGLSCVDAGSSGMMETNNLSNLTIGNTYYIKVSDFSTSLPTTFDFTICVSTAPLNDICDNAISLTPSSSCTNTSGTLENATTYVSPTPCGGNSDVFYKFVASTPSVSIIVDVNAGIDPIVGVLSSCASTSALTCVDNYADGVDETVNVNNLTIGSTYYIKVSDYSTTLPTTFDFTICVVMDESIPVNDNCTEATWITPSSTCTRTAGTVLNATTSTMPFICSGNSDVYYKFIATAPTATVNVDVNSGLDPVVGVFSSCSTSTFLDCVNNFFNGQDESVSLNNLTVGSTYYIKVSDYSSSLPTSYNFTICVESSDPIIPGPSNDICADATLLTPASACQFISGTVANASTNTLGSSDNCTGNSDVYYKFVAEHTAATVTTLFSNGIDGIVSVYPSCNSAPLRCIDDVIGTGGEESGLITGLTPGATYYIKVQDFSILPPTTSSFSICVINNAATSNLSAVGMQMVNVFPNPTSGVLFIEEIQASTRVEIIDIKGTLVYEKIVDSSSSLDISHLLSGVYRIKMTQGDIIDTRKLIIVQ